MSIEQLASKSNYQMLVNRMSLFQLKRKCRDIFVLKLIFIFQPNFKMDIKQAELKSSKQSMFKKY